MISSTHGAWATKNFVRQALPACRSSATADPPPLRDIKGPVGTLRSARLKNRQIRIISDLPEKLELSEWLGLTREQSKLIPPKTVRKRSDASPGAPGQKHPGARPVSQAQADLLTTPPWPSYALSYENDVNSSIYRLRQAAAAG